MDIIFEFLFIVGICFLGNKYSKEVDKYLDDKLGSRKD